VLPAVLALPSAPADRDVRGEMPGPHFLERQAQECQWQTVALSGDADAARRLGFCLTEVAGIPLPPPAELAETVGEWYRLLALQEANWQAILEERSAGSFMSPEALDVAKLLAAEASERALGSTSKRRGRDSNPR
jgi:hypothetical protein